MIISFFPRYFAEPLKACSGSETSEFHVGQASDLGRTSFEECGEYTVIFVQLRNTRSNDKRGGRIYLSACIS